MKTMTFRGGIHPKDNKMNTKDLKIENLSAPKTMIFPLQQHIGKESVPVVKPNDRVFVGQPIAKADGFVSANIHSSVSGKVVAIKSVLHPNRFMINSIIIENDGLYETYKDIKPNKDISKLSPQEILDIIRKAGIVGMGGAAFPTHVKLTIPADKKVDTVIVNGAECEPYLTSDHRVMLEEPDDVLYGLSAAMKALNVEKGFVAIETNKPDAIELLAEKTKDIDNIEIIPIKTKYPQGSEKQLIKAVTGREVPPRGLPADIGVVVLNIDTANSIAKAIKLGMPLIQRVVTIAGAAVKNPRNYRVRIGTPVKDVIDAAGGFNEPPYKVLLGGPMMGISIFDLCVPVIKGTGAIICLSKSEAAYTEGTNCIRCGKCVDACPMQLQPILLNAYAKKHDYEKLEELNIMDCMECGACTYICPSRQSIIQNIRVAKKRISDKKYKQ